MKSGGKPVRHSRFAVALIAATMTLTPLAIMSSQTSAGADSGGPQGIVAATCTGSGVAVSASPMWHGSTQVGEITLYYRSCDRVVRAQTVMYFSIPIDSTAEACLQTSTEPAGTFETCKEIFTGTTATTAWENDANILTRGYGYYVTPTNSWNSSAYTGYY